MRGSIEIRALNHLRRRAEFNAWHREIRLEYWSHSTTRRLWEYLCLRFKSAPPTLRRVSIQSMYDWVDAHSFKHKEEFWRLFQRMRRLEYNAKDPAVLAWLKRVRFKDVLERGINMLAESDSLAQLSVVRDQIDTLVKLSERSAAVPVRYFDTAQKRLNAARQGVIQFGIAPRFDDLCGGGAGLGELHIFLGATNIGKTAVLCNATAGALRQKKNVVYVTLDDCTAFAIARRVDQILLNATEERITKHPQEFQRRLALVREKGMGELVILDHNDRDTSVLDIRANVENLLDDGFRVDVLVLDYLDVMVASDTTKDDQRVFLQICRGLKKIGRDYKLRVYTAGQGNRSSLDADDIRLSQMAGAIAKAKSADVVYGLNQTPDQRAEDMMRFTCLRSRVFPRWTEEVWVTTNWGTMRIQGLELGR